MSPEGQPRQEFASDNTAGVAPEALGAFVDAGKGFAPAYGLDAWTRRAADQIRMLLDIDGEVHFLCSGTAANSLALAAICRSHEAVGVHRYAHVLTDEAGAPSFFGGGIGLVPFAGRGWKAERADVARLLAGAPSPHRQPIAAVSVANATELGGVYTPAELAPLIEAAHEAGAKVHLDGARLANAAAAGFEPRALGRLGVDVVVVGGTKAGMPGTEALVFRGGARPTGFDARLKQAGQLASKGRLLAAPWIGMLESGAWLERARQANSMAARLAAASPFPLAYPVESNAVFLQMPADAYAGLTRIGWAAFRISTGAVRFMCSWATTAAAVDELAETLRSLA